MTKTLEKILHRAAQWPSYAQEELIDIARTIDTEVDSSVYRATRDELKGIDRGLRAAHKGRFASRKKIDAAFAKFRRT
ncbi:hypothetical protein A3A39_02040 [Candidatus Kaiserbacteria bacterium RIFCSPLOWO2_01_FULL_54_13]|uniref:Uncharacterized protein n=1 Tax=Candidatus Kaiserbacteria bacterium RIFCSPLOWO2_01_FULL_54_13 TaxID=1798512 RepID=A0A1F6F155_9BACT|nr:MAG: hypothetical protein A3A39_02040 [Candidatus Kaiserbacteria bacterium RIFCSPLOWO2_01_FULL_54_13]